MESFKCSPVERSIDDVKISAIYVALTVWVKQCFENLEEKGTQSINESDNDKAVSRTAPVTPGLLTRWGCPIDCRPSRGLPHLGGPPPMKLHQ